MERVGVLVKDGFVENFVVWGDESAQQFADDGWDKAEEVTDLDPRPGIGWLWDESNGYRPPSPYPSRSWNGVGWTAPTPKPEGDYLWNEETQTWDAIPTEEPTP